MSKNSNEPNGIALDHDEQIAAFLGVIRHLSNELKVEKEDIEGIFGLGIACGMADTVARLQELMPNFVALVRAHPSVKEELC